MTEILTLVFTTVFVFIIQQLCLWCLCSLKEKRKNKTKGKEKKK